MQGNSEPDTAGQGTAGEQECPLACRLDAETVKPSARFSRSIDVVSRQDRVHIFRGGTSAAECRQGP